MRRIFAQRSAPVVAARTTSCDHTGMGIGGRLPERCRVTNITGLRRRYMGGRLGLRTQGGICATVTGRASPGRPRMIHRGRRKGREILVTGVACRAGRDVISRLAQCLGAVVASRANARRISVRKGHRCPRRRG